MRLYTERGAIVEPYDGFKASYFAHGENEWHIAILTFDPPTWGSASAPLLFYPYGQNTSPNPALSIDIARIFLLTDAQTCVDAFIEGASALSWVEEPVYAINDEARNAVFSASATDWSVVDNNAQVQIVSGALRITEPSSGSPASGLAVLGSSHVSFRPAKRYRLE
ncbi:MAG: hypothetical protein NZ473_09335, partial [Candidatus Kapabacteria bacterium]|nr:hypothetical protein [Candidatus Kapabacteria bacterium]MDW8226162.1 hypothetical protein [Bacteroidota bacterium]